MNAKGTHKTVNTKLQIPSYQKLKLLQVKLLSMGVDISLSDTLEGLIHYAENKGLNDNDKRFFNIKFVESTNKD